MMEVIFEMILYMENVNSSIKEKEACFVMSE